MPPPFVSLGLRQFRDVLDAWFTVHRRQIDAVHMHHTWRPDHSMYKGRASIKAMHRTHTQENGWADIAQHVTVAPDGVIWTGRHWDMPPASSGGMNGTRQQGPFMVEIIGNFDANRDPFEGAQREVALHIVALVQARFGLRLQSLKFHRGLGSPKTCPGEAIDFNATLKAVEARLGKEPPDLGAARGILGDTLVDRDPVAAARNLLEQPPMEASEDPNAEPPEEHGHLHDDSHLNGAAPPAPAPGSRAAPDALDPAVLGGLRPHVINLWGGRYSQSGGFSTNEGDVARIFEEELPKRIRAAADGTRLPILLYAHGGLISEPAGLRIAAKQVPWWNANGVYPIHFVWETGLLETLAQMFGVQPEAAGRDLESFGDRVIETVLRNAGGPHVWAGMKYAAARAFEEDGGGTDTLRHLAKFAQQHAGRFSLHAVGHSAGSVFQAYLLPSLAGIVGAPVESLSLLAPAITVADYQRRLDPLVGKEVERLTMFTMRKDWELADTVAPGYGKSLLYLVHHALEAASGEPILGLEESVRADPGLRRRFGLGGADGPAQVVWSPTEASTGPRVSRSTTHGGFDDDPSTMESVLRIVRNLPDDAQAERPFPPPAVAATFESLPAMPKAGTNGAGPPATDPRRTAPGDGAAASGARKALCVGVDAYADPGDRLQGCVADARAWEAALVGLGFQVDRLHEASATQELILQRLGGLIRSSRAGDAVVFVFAGHGTQVDDLDGDEGDDGQDEAICPVDYASGRLIIDDDLNTLFTALPAGVQLVCFFDNCHSGTNTRFAVGRGPPPPPGAVPRFVIARPEVQERHAEFRAGLGHSRAGRRSTPDEMRQVVFSACKPEEKALEINGRGDFSVRAVPLLASAGQVSNQAFADAVTKAFGARPRQHPMLDCAPAARDAVFLPLAGDARGVGAPDMAGAGMPKSGMAGAGTAGAVADLLQAAARVLRQGG